MDEQIAQFPQQFSWDPDVLNADHLPTSIAHVLVCGMGGSHLGARLLLRASPELPLSIHSDYGLPSTITPDTLVVASSYSGNTEETLDAARAARAAGFPIAIMTTGGALAAFAEEHGLPLVRFPLLSIEPRMAVGVQMLAIARFLGDAELERTVREAGLALDPSRDRRAAAATAAALGIATPVIYASTRNHALAYFWKIALNETGKVPAFSNIFPELCHNELSGYDTPEAARERSTRLHAIMLTDADDHPRIAKRMALAQELLEARGTSVSVFPLSGTASFEKTFSGVLAGAWFALAVAHTYGSPDAATPLIAEFKKRMAS